MLAIESTYVLFFTSEVLKLLLFLLIVYLYLRPYVLHCLDL